MIVRFKTTPPSRDWRARCRKRGWTLKSKLPAEFEPEHEELKKKLLGVVGFAVCLPRPECDLRKILKRGQFFRGYNSISMPGLDSKCHLNSALLWLENTKNIRICTGYTVTRDGCWRQHSWCLTIDNIVVETTVKRLLYFGFILTMDEADNFALTSLAHRPY